ncbi:uncharacterized protein P884DRAFT_259524 [Thermothelomyces heterothallicus CBS 202.75]|uniref:uncharacterized protein n=1 Tax=Thermothelomyces heterothallicus CBS 202.75 TaxID=1149848 RepID=UPI003742C42C
MRWYPSQFQRAGMYGCTVVRTPHIPLRTCMFASASYYMIVHGVYHDDGSIAVQTVPLRVPERLSQGAIKLCLLVFKTFLVRTVIDCSCIAVPGPPSERSTRQDTRILI